MNWWLRLQKQIDKLINCYSCYSCHYQRMLQQSYIQLHPMNKKITLLRIQKETASLTKEPVEQAALAHTQTLVFHFCLYGLEEDFKGGFYHGVLQLSEDYPFSPPKIWFLTQNGRFEVSQPICTTFTHYHKETWSSSWNVRTILTALISFMYSNQRGIGGLFYSPSRRRTLAKKSLKKNCQNEQFVNLFKDQLITRNILSPKELEQIASVSAKEVTVTNQEDKEALQKKKQSCQRQQPTLETNQEVKPEQQNVEERGEESAQEQLSPEPQQAKATPQTLSQLSQGRTTRKHPLINYQI